MQKQATDIDELRLGTKLCCKYCESSKPSRHGPCPNELTLQSRKTSYFSFLPSEGKYFWSYAR